VKVRSQLALGVVLVLCGLTTKVQAETLRNFLMQSKFDGQLRAYYFSRNYGASGPNTDNQDAFSLGGIVNAKTAPFLGGFGLGVSFYTANALGTNTGNPAKLDATLMGTKSSIDALGQAYIQYELPKVLLIRAGDQTLNTPWINGSDSRALPDTYQGVFVDVSPYGNLHLYGMRIFRWKSRTSSDYYRDNLYYPATIFGDDLNGGAAALPMSAPANNGVLAFGAAGSAGGFKGEAWYYNYYQFANQVYLQGSYTLKTSTGIAPFVAAQFSREYGNNSLLNGTRINNSPTPATSVNSVAWGAEIGVNYPAINSFIGKGQLSYAYNQISAHNYAVGGGAIIAPYTVGYATDPLFTTAMIRGLVETGPGNAWKVKWTQHLLDNQVQLIVAYAQFQTVFSGKSYYPYLDATYFFQGALKGLSIRNRFEVGNGYDATAGATVGNLPNGAGFNKGHSFIYNRVMLTYDF